MITTDPIKLRQVLMNLVSNAAKLTESGRIEIKLSLLGSNLGIVVSDTGIGIKVEDLGRLITAFSQVENVKTKIHEGTGLKLTISKNLVELIGGTISLTSNYGLTAGSDLARLLGGSSSKRSAYGRGAMFTLTLPLRVSEWRRDLYAVA